MLGESIITSAADPTKAGQSVREVGTNPFIVGSEGEEGNLFYRIIRKNPSVQCFLLNTGGFGGQKIRIQDSAAFIREIARSRVEWRKDEY